MTIPVLSVLSAAVEGVEAELLVLAVRKGDDGPELLAPDVYAPLADELRASGVTGSEDQVRRLPDRFGAASGLVLVGLGPDADDAAFRRAAGAVTRTIDGQASIAFVLTEETAAAAEAVLEGAAIGAYRYTASRGVGSAPAPTPLGQITVVVPSTVDAPDAGLAEHATAVAEAIALVKDLVNTPPNELYPATFADAARAAIDGLDVEVEEWDEARLAEDGFGGILGVGQGSSRPPRLVKLSYHPEAAKSHLALVGKGITFDSGGLSLKPPVSMVGMKYDMTGAATVLAVLAAAARLGVPTRLTAWLCLAENLPSGTAIRPNDVLTIRGGRTVEVTNTDAEGRLVLADGLVAAGEEGPDAIIDVATLTGAAVVALGNRYTGVMGDASFVTDLIATGSGADELFWPMPFPAELRKVLDSDVADLANAKPGTTAGGMLVAGTFLQEFIADRTDEEGVTTRIPWAHLDIAGSAMNGDAPYGFTAKGPTGVAVRTLLAMAEEISHP
ncbi:leucyl aminopeptidase [Plantibacter sp. CFBP 8804]|uniref:leucyl aminopeptidase n=1 Tax=Plantibacter sp. CFBP 8804 TaxID=2775270 RepID=UPI0017873F82|nr:leucyl aminopeptidase [Plantibacter sp. CFBP 8804]MBD8515615.1 leucyl aminopeptidase [Plantibacter sp. CFBP 8804]